MARKTKAELERTLAEYKDALHREHLKHRDLLKRTERLRKGVVRWRREARANRKNTEILKQAVDNAGRAHSTLMAACDKLREENDLLKATYEHLYSLVRLYLPSSLKRIKLDDK